MSEKFFTSETEVFQVKTDSLIEFNETDVEKFNSITQSISKETGVPRGLIYTAPYLFFINRWHKIDGEWFYLKCDNNDFYFINELMGEVISEYFDLDTVHYKIAQLNVDGENKGYGVLAKNFCDVNNTYMTAWDYHFEPSKDLSILEKIKNICLFEEEYLLLLNDMKKMFIRDFYTAQRDRAVNNLLFKINNDGVRLAPLYNYEYSFEALDKHKYSNPIGELNISNSTTKERLLEDHKFQELLYMLMKANMKSFIDKVEERHKILVPEDIKDIYIKHDTEVKGLVLKNNIVK